MSLPNQQNLITFLAGLTPSTTATAVLNALTPVAYTEDASALSTRRFGLNVADVNTLAATQSAFKSLIAYGSDGTTPQGTRISDLLTLAVSTVKALLTLNNQKVALTVTTNATGDATVDLTSYGYSAAPNIQCQVISTTTNQATSVMVVSRSTTSVVLKTLITQNILLGIIAPTTPVSCQVMLQIQPS